MAMSSLISAELLQALLSVNAAERKAAEEQLNATSLPDRVMAFVEALTTTTTTTTTTGVGGGDALMHVVAVLLRRDISKTTDVSLLQGMVGPLLQAFGSVPCSTKTDVGHCLAEICAALETTTADGNLGTVVITQILSTIAPAASQGDLPSLRLLVALARRSPKSFTQIALFSLPQLIQTLVTHPVFHIQPDEEIHPRWPNRQHLYTEAMHVVTAGALATVGGDSNFLQVAVSENDTEDGRPDSDSPASQLGTRAFLPLLSLDGAALWDTSTASKVLPLWMEASQATPDLFVGSDPHVWELVVQHCLNVAAQDQDTKLAIQAFHVLNNLVSRIKNQLPPNVLRSIMQSAIPRLMNILPNEVDSDVNAWASEPVSSSVIDKDTFGDDDGEAHYAYEQLQAWIRVLPSLAVDIVLPLLECLLAGGWTHKWAAAVCIQACAEDARVTFINHIPTTLREVALPLTESSNPRVQYQAIQLLCILCETGNSIVWEEFGEHILRALARAIGSASDRIKAMACTTLVAYCLPDAKDKVDGERFVAPYLFDLLDALVAGPMNGPTVVQSRAVQAVICLAHVSGPLFAQYYSRIMPVLLTLAQQAKSNEYEDIKLQTTAIEAATVLGQSLGEEHKILFAEDASRIMAWVIPVLQKGHDESSNIPMGQLLSACARIASLAGAEYAGYAQDVIPHLIRRAQAKTDIEIAEGDVSDVERGRTGFKVDEETGKETVTLAIPGQGYTKLTINTANIEEKVEAIRGIYEHAMALEAHFQPYAQDCLELLLPLLQFRFAADVRSTSAQSLFAVYEALCCVGDETGDFSLCSIYLPKLVLATAQAARNEKEMDSLYAVADALSEVLHSTFIRRKEHGQALMQNFSVGDAKTLANLCLRSILVPCLERRSKITQKLHNPANLSGEDEKESYYEHLQEEEKLLTPIVDSIGYTLKLFGESFYQVFKEEFMPILGPYLSAGLDIRARLSAVCLFDDCVEFCGASAASEIGSALLNGIMVGLDDVSDGGDNELKQACVYGIIQLARYAPANLMVPHGPAIVNFVLTIISSGSKEAAPSPALFENCVSAVASLFLIGQAPFRSLGLMPPAMALSIFLENLPLTEDCDEAKKNHAGFCDLVLSGQIDVDNECGTIVRITGEILALAQEDKDFVTQETCERLAQILVQLQNSPKSTVVEAAFHALPCSSKSAISAALGGKMST